MKPICLTVPANFLITIDKAKEDHYFLSRTELILQAVRIYVRRKQKELSRAKTPKRSRPEA